MQRPESHIQSFVRPSLIAVLPLTALQQCKPQNLASTVWAHAEAGDSHPKLFQIIADHIMPFGDSETYGPQEGTQIVWAYLCTTSWARAEAGDSHPELFQIIADRILSLGDSETCGPKEGTQIVRA